jgi:hypothetical protein
MQTKIYVSLIMPPHILQALARMKQDWEQAAEGGSLLKVKGSVGLLLADFTNVLWLTQEKQIMVLGEAMTAQLQDVLTTTTDKMEM